MKTSLKKGISFILSLSIFFGIFVFQVPNVFACDLDNEFYEAKIDDFYESSDTIFIGKVKNTQRTDTSTKVTFEILSEQKGILGEKEIEIFRDDYTMCQLDYFLEEAKKDEIFLIFAAKKKFNFLSENTGKYTIVHGHNKISQKFDSLKSAEKFIKESCTKCSEQKQEQEVEKEFSEKIPENIGIIEKISNWIKSFFKN